MFDFFKKLFCKHDYELCTKKTLYVALNGERVYKVCKKCGHVGGSYWKEW